MQFIQISDDTELSFCDWGSGTPVVLIHGWPLSGAMWEKQAEFLASRGCRVIFYDRRGFGFSSQPWSGYDYDTFAADLNALMEDLDLEGVVLVGFSMGGGEVVRYLTQYGSDRVSRAVLVSAVTPFLLKTPDNPDGIDQEEFGKIEKAIREDRPAFMKEFGQKFYGRSLVHHTVSDALLEWNQVLVMQASLRSTLAAAEAWATTDFRDDLRNITIPVLVIHGTDDHTVPIDKSGRRVKEFLPHAMVIEYDGEPHGLFVTAADRLNADLLQFIQTGDVSLGTDSQAEILQVFPTI
ncbi:MAG: alpha/beta hydrolase fold protein [Bryobacterales bacterium]|nr:alpha/beta hydrolase fold protein [Bryobacterales bacterium]